MPNAKNICILIDDSITSAHHGVRRYLFALYEAITNSGSIATFIEGNEKDGWLVSKPGTSLMQDNGFIVNRLIGETKNENIRNIKAGVLESFKSGNLKLDLIKTKVNLECLDFDLCIIGAPWILKLKDCLPKAEKYICIAYDAIPNIYYFNNPRDRGLHDFAFGHAQGYRLADEVGRGLFCISEETKRQCKLLGFGSSNGLKVVPPLLPPGYRNIDNQVIMRERGRVAILAAPFDLRKGLKALPAILNHGDFDEVIVFGRPRCSYEDLLEFFVDTNCEKVQWWCDVDFKKQIDLYTRAKVLVFPSLNEGLGFPVLEAYACGTSVLVSNISPLNKLAIKEDVINATKQELENQVKRRCNEKIESMKYRKHVEVLCTAGSFLQMIGDTL